MILDKSQRTEQYSAADFVLHAGIDTYIDDKHAIAHNKIMLIDGQTIITGSFNFTKAAEDVERREHARDPRQADAVRSLRRQLPPPPGPLGSLRRTRRSGGDALH